MAAIAALALTACGGDDENTDGPSGGEGGGETSVLPANRNDRFKLLEFKQSEASDQSAVLEYDAQNRVTKVVHEGGWCDTYTYEDDRIIADYGGFKNTYLLENGRIRSIHFGTGNVYRYEYDEEGRVVKCGNNEVVWKDGNISNVRVTYSDGSRKNFRFEYGSAECVTPLIYARYTVEWDHYGTPYTLVEMDAVLVAEGYFGNSYLKNIMTADLDGFGMHFIYTMEKDGVVTRIQSEGPTVDYYWE